jgi:two-component system nitrogen regulation response regulator NtrX
MVIMTPGGRLEVRHLPSVVLKENGFPEDPAEARSLSEARLAFDRDYILKKLEENGGNMSRTADALGIERSHLYRKLKSLRINLERN